MAKEPLDESKAHYESLISLFKYVIGIITGLFTLIGLAIGYITYSDGKEMREDAKAKREEMIKEVNEVKQELRDKIKRVDEELITLSMRANKEIDQTRIDAIRQVSDIRNSASAMAQSEARRKIDQVFEDKNLDTFIVKVAKDRIEPRIKGLVDQTFAENENRQMQIAVNKMLGFDRAKINEGINYLQLNIETRLTGFQQKEIIAALEETKRTKESRLQIAHAVYRRKSSLFEDFFRKAILDSESIFQPLAVTYYLTHDVNFNLLVDGVLVQMKTDSPVLGIYYGLFDVLKDSNRPNVIKLLNSEILVDHLYKVLQKSDYDKSKIEIKNRLKNSFTEGELKNTYFFSRP